MVTPSLIICGVPFFFSNTTFRPFGPNVTETASTMMLIPFNKARRASSLYKIFLPTIKCFK